MHEEASLVAWLIACIVFNKCRTIFKDLFQLDGDPQMIQHCRMFNAEWDLNMLQSVVKVRDEVKRHHDIVKDGVIVPGAIIPAHMVVSPRLDAPK
ncbi:hypothetical protein DXG01_015207, partial [Tephrocybe rancida]